MSSYSRVDPIALSFNESCLRISDVQLLQGPHWLNDQIISFYYEYLEKIKYKNNPDILFVSPEVTQCMKLTGEDEMKIILNQLNAPNKHFIFFVLNNNKTGYVGGTHWSLLVLSRPEKTFFHFDSFGNSNTKVFHNFVQRVKEALNCRYFGIKSVRCLQQSNDYDCGIHVICMTDNIADSINRFEAVEGAEPLHQDTVSAKRSDILKLIQSLGGKI